MRYVAILLIISAVALGALGMGSYYYLDKSAAKVAIHINRTENHILGGDWAKARSSFLEVQVSWDKTKKWWAVIIDHQEIDNIDQSLARVKQFIETSNKSHAQAEIAVLKLFVKHIPEKEAFNIGNIF